MQMAEAACRQPSDTSDRLSSAADTRSGPEEDGLIVTATLLLVEDDARIRHALALALEDEGYRVVGTPTGEEALQYLDRSGFEADLVLLDVMLPGIDGFEVCHRIRERGGLPIIW